MSTSKRRRKSSASPVLVIDLVDDSQDECDCAQVIDVDNDTTLPTKIFQHGCFVQTPYGCGYIIAAKEESHKSKRRQQSSDNDLVRVQLSFGVGILQRAVVTSLEGQSNNALRCSSKMMFNDIIVNFVLDKFRLGTNKSTILLNSFSYELMAKCLRDASMKTDTKKKKLEKLFQLPNAEVDTVIIPILGQV